MSDSLSIVADQQITQAQEFFSNFGRVELVDGRLINQDTIANADVLLVRSVTQVNESLLKNSNVRFVGSATSGIDHVDSEYLDKSSIQFVHAPGSNARSVAEYVLSSLCVVADLKDFNLKDKTVGIIGHGQVGSRLARFLEILGVKVLINDPPLSKIDDSFEYASLDQIMGADIITLHVPLTHDGEYPTYRLINENFLNNLRNDVVFINTSRGEVVDESALIDFKTENSNSTLVLDVWCNEPNINPQLLQSTLIATPHIAGYSFDGKLKATRMLAEDLQDFTNTETESLDELIPSLEQNLIELKEDSIELAIMQSYDVRVDAVGLRQLFSIKQAEAGEFFDELRKNYPVRREFNNYNFISSHLNKQISTQLQQLGYRVIQP